MSNIEVSRRFVVGALGAGAAAVATQVTAGQSHACEAVAPAAEAAPLVESAERTAALSLVAPLAAGSTLGTWQVVAVEPLTDGAVTVLMRDAEGTSFQVDICARDAAADAARGPGTTRHFELFLANTGNGTTATHEAHGLAVMALAEVVRANEGGVDASGFRVLRDRLQLARRLVG